VGVSIEESGEEDTDQLKFYSAKQIYEEIVKIANLFLNHLYQSDNHRSWHENILTSEADTSSCVRRTSANIF
jgi:hypothetical protein